MIFLVIASPPRLLGGFFLYFVKMLASNCSYGSTKDNFSPSINMAAVMWYYLVVILAKWLRVTNLVVVGSNPSAAIVLCVCVCVFFTLSIDLFFFF